LSGRKIVIETAEVFDPLLARDARYLAAHGGRSSGKSHFFGELCVDEGASWPGENGGEGLRLACIREVQKTLSQSSKLLIEDKIRKFGLSERDGFKVYHDRIALPGDGIISFMGMKDATAENIKSLEKYHRGWWEEAQTATTHSVRILRPTIRQPGSQIWFSWNPRRKTDPVDVMFRQQEPPPRSRIVRANWRDNPWFTDEMEEERLDCLKNDPDQYDWIWEGDYIQVMAGAYYREQLTKAKEQGRIDTVVPDPLAKIRTFHDIGGAGAKADNYAIWVVQFVGMKILLLDYYEAQGQTLEYHVKWMRKHGYEDAAVYLPHDGSNTNNVSGKKYADHWEEAGFDVETVKNQGPGAAMQRIEAGRRLFPRMWFDDKTEPGREALGWYHEKYDEVRGIGLGPDHDWSSHGSDAFGLMAICYEEPTSTADRTHEQRRVGWMAR